VSDEAAALEIRGLTRRFGELVAVRDLHLRVARGEVFGLVGPDGAGKTTTLRIACGLMNATSGEVRVAGFDVAKDAESVKDRIGYMAQKFGLYGDLSVDENMEFYGDLFGIDHSERERLSLDLLRMTRMEPFRERPAAKLSGGMKQKLALMCTLLHRPEILFLDEPTNGVDPVSRRDFWEILYQLVREGLTVVVTTAYLDEAERCDRVGLMDKGRLLMVDTPLALRNSLPEVCLEVRGHDLRSLRDQLRGAVRIVDVELAGSALHVFADPGTTAEQVGALIPEAQVRRITPSLEDVLIATLRREQAAEVKGEGHHAAA
jgi:ABC-2 type transport system ATP-binding protein